MFRTGIGEDVHRTDPSRPLILGGVLIEDGPGLRGHSDADVLLHALIDALLGAAALGDIGEHFPPADSAFREADSADLLRRVVEIVRRDGWEIENVDSTVHAEAPVLRPYKAAIRDRIAAVAGIEPGRVSVKAKTGEGLDAVGRGEAIRAVALVLLVPEAAVRARTGDEKAAR